MAGQSLAIILLLVRRPVCRISVFRSRDSSPHFLFLLQIACDLGFGSLAGGSCLPSATFSAGTSRFCACCTSRRISMAPRSRYACPTKASTVSGSQSPWLLLLNSRIRRCAVLHVMRVISSLLMQGSRDPHYLRSMRVWHAFKRRMNLKLVCTTKLNPHVCIAYHTVIFDCVAMRCLASPPKRASTSTSST
jgi:hypothetical protein